MMASPGSVQLLLLIVVGAALVVPSWRILGRMGLAGAWSLVIFIPLGGLILLWVIAFVDWPAAKANSSSSSA